MTKCFAGLGQAQSAGIALRRSGNWLLLLAVLGFATPLVAATESVGAPSPWKTVFENAEFVLSDSPLPPVDAAWQPVSLPDDWRRLGADVRGRGWYQIKFKPRAIPVRPLAVYVRHMRSVRMDLFLNGTLLGGSSDLHGPTAQATGFQIFMNIPPDLLRPGENILHVRMDARSVMNPAPGLGRVTLGDMRAIREISLRENNLTGGAYRQFFAAMLTAGVIALFLWFARRGDQVMLWFSVLCLSWAGASGISYYLQGTEIPAQLIRIAQHYANQGLPAPSLILCLRTVGLRWPRVEAILWAHLAFVLTMPLWSTSPYAGWAWSYLRIANPLLPLVGAIVVSVAAPRPVRWSYRIEVLALLTMSFVFGMDISREMGWVELDVHNYRPYHVPLLLLAFGAAIFDRHVAAFWRTERMNVELERRVAEKAHEIEINHKRVQDALHEQALAAERQRLLADMHDGLGTSLISLLRHVQSGQADSVSIEQRVQVALQEMRIAIDALQPNEGDLAAVLGSLRYRLDNMINATGLHFVWEVGDLPAIEELKPSTVFSLQRILLEAITNVLKHSGARELRIAARARDRTEIEICIEDDGCGFDPAQSATGLGLTNMRSRAARIGARLDMLSQPGKGTSVKLTIPVAAVAPAVKHTPATTDGISRDRAIASASPDNSRPLGPAVSAP